MNSDKVVPDTAADFSKTPNYDTIVNYDTIEEYDKKHPIIVDEIMTLQSPIIVYKKVLLITNPLAGADNIRSYKGEMSKFIQYGGDTSMREFGLATLIIPTGARVYCGSFMPTQRNLSVREYQDHYYKTREKTIDTILKYRCDVAKVHHIEDSTGITFDTARSIYGQSTSNYHWPKNDIVYRVGDLVRPEDPLDEAPTGCCGSGIHFVESPEDAWKM